MASFKNPVSIVKRAGGTAIVGEGTDYTLDTPANQPLNLTPMGDSYQQTYSGKNLLQNTGPDTDTTNGVTFDKNSDGSVSATGTAGGGGAWYQVATTDLQAGEVLSGCPTGGGANTYSLQTGSYGGSLDPDYGSGVSVRNGTAVAIWIIIRSGQTVDNLTFYPQLEVASSKTAYEPYVGGIPAPNPSYPQDIKVVTGEQTVNIYGKNLLNATTPETSQNGIVYSGDANQIYLNGVITTTGSLNWNNTSIKAGTYKLMLELVSGSITSTAGTPGAMFYLYGNNISQSPQHVYLSSANPRVSKTITLSDDSDNAHLNIWCRTTETFTNAVIKYQLVKGTEDDYDFEPSYTFDLKKNKVDGAYSNIVTWVRSTGSAYGNGFTITSNQSSGATYAVLPIPDVGELLGKEVTVSCVDEGTGTLIRIFYLNGASATTQIVGLSGNGGTFTMPASISAGNDGIGICFYTSNNASASYTNIQLEVGDTATSYTPIIELCKLGDYQDYLWTDGIKWYKHKEIYKYTLPSGIDFMGIDGSSSSAITASTQGTFSILRGTSVPVDVYNAFLKNTRLCSMATYSDVSVAGNTGAVNLPDGAFTQRSGTNDRVYYKNTGLIGKTGTQCGALFAHSVWYGFLDAPTDEEITDTILVSDLNTMKSALSYSPTTNISSGTPGSDLPVIVGSAVITGV